jgi:hypothetical protein
MAIAMTGCPYFPGWVDPEYEQGFSVGFMEDAWYWQGFDDSFATVGFEPLYYQGSEIPYAVTPPYDVGYWDGVWYAYNDGYFVAYDYAFTIGFSEGYDAANRLDYLAFLTADEHVEYLNGGWDDGYNDGFSEGRVFGANDFEMDLFDWLDALLDYRAGVDLYFEEVDVGTGDYGPVTLYVYGTDPATSKAAHRSLSGRGSPGRSIRAVASVKTWGFEPPELSYRSLTAEAAAELDVAPATSPRSDRPLTLTTTWLERVNAYVNATQPAAKNLRSRRVSTK